MKKILYSVFMLATMVLAACSSDDTTEPVVKRGMVLKANVEDTDTRATLTDNEGKWKFAFATNDEVKVGNDQVTDYYTFKNNGTEFASADALQTTKDATWYAYFPGETIDLKNQSGDFADVANKYALAGATASATTGSDGLTVTMKAKAAVLRIVGVNKDEKLDISVKTADDGKYVSGLKAVKNSEGFSVETSDTKVSLLSKQGVVVPAGVKISVSNGDKSLYSGDKPMSTTKADGLKAGKYYTLTTGMTKGSAKNSLGETIDWVQLWAGGPKFAKENVKDKLTFTDACKTGDAYVWGKNWRTPKLDELNFINYKDNYDDVLGYYVTATPLNTKVEVRSQGGVLGLLYTGIQPGYTDKTLFLPTEGSEGALHVIYWASTVIKQGYGTSLGFLVEGSTLRSYYLHEETYMTDNIKYRVRPVLVEK